MSVSPSEPLAWVGALSLDVRAAVVSALPG